MKQQDRKRVRDAGTWDHGVDSDHRAIRLRLEIARNVTDFRIREPRVDRSLLKDPVTLKAFREAVSENVGRLRGSTIDGRPATALQVLEGAMVAAAKHVLMSDGRRRPGWFVAAKATLGPEIAVRNQLTKAYGPIRGMMPRKRSKPPERGSNVQLCWPRRVGWSYY